MKKIITVLGIVAGMLLILPAMTAQQQATEVNDMLFEAMKAANGISAAQDFPRAYRLFTKCAQAGSPVAMNALGVLHQDGLGVEKDPKLAKEWFEKAARAGYGTSWYNLGMLYKYGMNDQGKPDYPMAISYFLKGVESGYPPAMYASGYMYYKGFGVPQDYTTAIRYFEQCVQASNAPEALHFLGLCHARGYGVKKDKKKAESYFVAAIKLGFLESLKQLDELNGNPKALDGDSDLEKISYGQVQAIDARTRLATETAAGQWRGKEVIYDWSGSSVFSQREVLISLSFRDNTLTGTWEYTDTGEKIALDGMLHGSEIYFHKAEAGLDKVQWKIQTGRFGLLAKGGKNLLISRIQKYSDPYKEPMAPAMLVLQQGHATVTPGEVQELLQNVKTWQDPTLYVHPNPFREELTVQYNLPQTAQVVLQVLNTQGALVQTHVLGQQPAGLFSWSYTSELPAGTYLFKLVAGGVTATQLVIKK